MLRRRLTEAFRTARESRAVNSRISCSERAQLSEFARVFSMGAGSTGVGGVWGAGGTCTTWKFWIVWESNCVSRTTPEGVMAMRVWIGHHGDTGAIRHDAGGEIEIHFLGADAHESMVCVARGEIVVLELNDLLGIGGLVGHVGLLLGVRP